MKILTNPKKVIPIILIVTLIFAAVLWKQFPNGHIIVLAYLGFNIAILLVALAFFLLKKF